MAVGIENIQSTAPGGSGTKDPTTGLINSGPGGTFTTADMGLSKEAARNILASGQGTPQQMAAANAAFYGTPTSPTIQHQSPQVQFNQNPAFQGFRPNLATQNITGPLSGGTGNYQNPQFLTQQSAQDLAGRLGGQVQQTDFQRFGQVAPEYQINLGGQDNVNAGLIADAITKYGFDNPFTQSLLRQGTPGNMPFNLPGQTRTPGAGGAEPGTRPTPPPPGTKFGGPGDTAGGPAPPPPGSQFAGSRPFGQQFNPLGGFYGYPTGYGAPQQVNADPYGYGIPGAAGGTQNQQGLDAWSQAQQIFQQQQMAGGQGRFGGFGQPQFGNMDFGGGLSALQSGLFGGGGLPFGRGFYGSPQQNFGNYGGFGFGGGMFGDPLSGGGGSMQGVAQLLQAIQGLRGGMGGFGSQQRRPEMTSVASGRRNFYPGFF